MSERVIMLGPWEDEYQPDQDEQQGKFSMSRFRCGLNMMRAGSKAVPLGFGVECRVADGYVLAAVVRQEFADNEIKGVGRLMRTGFAGVPRGFVGRRLQKVQEPTESHRPHRGTYLERAYNQFDGYLMSALGTDPPEPMDPVLVMRHGLHSSLLRQDVLKKLPKLLDELAEDPYLWNGLVPLHPEGVKAS